MFLLHKIAYTSLGKLICVLTERIANFYPPSVQSMYQVFQLSMFSSLTIVHSLFFILTLKVYFKFILSENLLNIRFPTYSDISAVQELFSHGEVTNLDWPSWPRPLLEYVKEGD